MINTRACVLCSVICLLAALLCGCKSSDAGPTAEAERPSQIIVTETYTTTIEDGGTGPYKAILASDSTLATHSIFRPKDLNAFGSKNKLPILAWGNGACANSPQGHINFLSQIASQGFLVIAIGPAPQAGQAGRGGGMMGGSRTTASQLTDAIDWAIAQDSNKSSQYYKRIDITKVAVSGMSCGGLQALEVAPDPRVTTLIVCNSGIGIACRRSKNDKWNARRGAVEVQAA